MCSLCGSFAGWEKMAALCREFAISRKTGYKIFDRYKESGLEAPTDRSRRPWRYGNQLPQPVPYRAIKTNIADSLNIIIQIEWRPGSRFVSEVLEIRGYAQEVDQYDLHKVYLYEMSQTLRDCAFSVTSPW